MNDIKPYNAGQEKFGTWMIRNYGRLQVAIYRASGGRLWNSFRGARVAILTSIGRKSGVRRHTPLIHVEDGERVVIAASKGGMSTPPLWMHNLLANPACEIQIGNRNRPMRARVADAREEDQFWPRLAALYPDFNDYRIRAGKQRHIPLFILEP